MRYDFNEKRTHCVICGEKLGPHRKGTGFPFCGEECYWVQIRKVAKKMLERRGWVPPTQKPAKGA